MVNHMIFLVILYYVTVLSFHLYENCKSFNMKDNVLLYVHNMVEGFHKLHFQLMQLQNFT